MPLKHETVFPFEDENRARTFFNDNHGAHYAKSGISKYKMSTRLRESLEIMMNNPTVSKAMGNSAKLNAFHSLVLPIRMVEYNKAARGHANWPKVVGEKLQLFVPYEFEGITLAMDRLRDGDGWYDYEPSTTGVTKGSIELPDYIKDLFKVEPTVEAPNGVLINTETGMPVNPEALLESEDGYVPKKKIKRPKVAPPLTDPSAATIYQMDNSNYPKITSGMQNLMLNCVLQPVTSYSTTYKSYLMIGIDAYITMNADKTYSLVVDSRGIMPLVHTQLSGRTPTNALQHYVDDILNQVSMIPGSKIKLTTIIVNNVSASNMELLTNVKTTLDVNDRRRFTSVSGKRTFVYTEGVLESFDDYTATIKPVTRESVIEAWSKAVSATLVADLKKEEKKLTTIKQSLIDQSQTVGEKKMLLAAMQTGASERFNKSLDEIALVPNVESVEFQEGIIIAHTKDIWYTPSGKYESETGKKPKYVGKFQIYLGIMNRFAYFINTHMPIKNGRPHPHTLSDNSACMGGYAGMIGHAYEAFDYELVVGAILSLLQSVTEDDSVGRRNMIALPLTKPKTGKVSDIVMMYGDRSNITLPIGSEIGGNARYDEDDEEE